MPKGNPRVLVIGATGIIGQTLMMMQDGWSGVFTSTKQLDPLFQRFSWPKDSLHDLMDSEPWDFVVNLAGINSPDAVEASPNEAWEVNVHFVSHLAIECNRTGARLIQVSSQAVFDGQQQDRDMGSLDLSGEPVNKYGRQKREAEEEALNCNAVIVRPTYVLGVRPFHRIGRENPLEAMARHEPIELVNDRHFSVSGAQEVAEAIIRLFDAWPDAMTRTEQAVMVGWSESFTRYTLAQELRPLVSDTPIAHNSGRWAQRPHDTAYSQLKIMDYAPVGGLSRWARRTISDAHRPDTSDAVAAAVLAMPVDRVQAQRMKSFGQLHAEVAEDFRARCKSDAPADLLEWYRTTPAYIWELLAYHDDASGFNYSGMCRGILDRLRVSHLVASDVLVLGDGIGTLTLAARKAGFLNATYHDLAGSLTARYAMARHVAEGLSGPNWLTESFDPAGMPQNLRAVISLDYLEHVPNVEQWVRAVYAALRHGGLFVAQNAFACGSGREGSIPMHLSENDRWEKDWDTLLASVGFEQLSPQWYRKVVV